MLIKEMMKPMKESLEAEETIKEDEERENLGIFTQRALIPIKYTKSTATAQPRKPSKPQTPSDSDWDSIQCKPHTPSSSDSEETSSNGDDANDAEVATQAKGDVKKEKMCKITVDERIFVCTWISKVRKDGTMTNGRWIRNGGAKGATMTATSGEVRTSGAYDALAA
jgi:hypothetical protein